MYLDIFNLFITTLYFKNGILKTTIYKKKIYPFNNYKYIDFCKLTVWIYAVETNRIIDASFGYFIFPIISVFFGYLFFNEKLNKRIVSLILVIISTLYLLISFKTLPWIGLTVAFFGVYIIYLEKINVDTDVGLFIESLFFLPLALLIYYLIFINNLSDFSLSNSSLMFLLFLAGPMTVIPFFYMLKELNFQDSGHLV